MSPQLRTALLYTYMDNSPHGGRASNIVAFSTSMSREGAARAVKAVEAFRIASPGESFYPFQTYSFFENSTGTGMNADERGDLVTAVGHGWIRPAHGGRLIIVFGCSRARARESGRARA